MRDKGLWIKKTIKECWDKIGRPPVTVWWVEINKGDDVCPNILSRLVARQIRGPGQDAVFAPTPPLEALRTVLTLAATDLSGKPKRCRLPNSDMRTLFFLLISAVLISTHPPIPMSRAISSFLPKTRTEGKVYVVF